MVRGRVGSGAAGIARDGRRRAPRVGVVLFALSLLFFGVNYAQEWWVGHQVQQEAAQLREQIRQAEAHNADLQRAIVYYNSKPYIVRRAREIGMAGPGDTLVVFQQGPPQVRVVRVARTPPVADNPLARLLHALFQ